MRQVSVVMILFTLAGCSRDEGQVKAQVCQTWYDPAYGDTIPYTLILEPGGDVKWYAERGNLKVQGTYRFVASDIMEWTLSYTLNPAKDQAGKGVPRNEILRVRIERLTGDELKLTFLNPDSPIARKNPVLLTSRTPKG